MPMEPALRRFLDERRTYEETLGLGDGSLSDVERVELTRAQLLEAVRTRRDSLQLPSEVVARDVQLKQGLRGRLFLPAHAAGPLPILVHLHGGGWIAGGLETHDPFFRLLTHASGVSLLAVDYRLAPEHRFPAPLKDALAALAWVEQHASEWGGDLARLALGGDSAGAQIAAVAAQLAAPSGSPRLAAQLLLFPVTDHASGGHASYSELGHGFGAEFMHWIWRQYAPRAAPGDPTVSPLRCAPLPPLPPTFIATAQYDILRDEGLAYVDKLRAAGVIVTHEHAPDMHHNFCVNPATISRFPQCDQMLGKIAAWLRQTLQGR